MRARAPALLVATAAVATRWYLPFPLFASLQLLSRLPSLILPATYCVSFPRRYRSQLCNDGQHCRRRVCFFAHKTQDLRVPPVKPFVPPELLASLQAEAERAQPQPAFPQLVRHRHGLRLTVWAGQALHCNTGSLNTSGGGVLRCCAGVKCWPFASM